MRTIQLLLDGVRQPGMYRVDAKAQPDAIQRQVEEHGWRFFHIDGAAVADKRSFIRAAGDAMRFPGYSRQNWDAFEESLRDLTWAAAQGYLVLFDEPDQFAERNPGEWAVAQAILADAVAFWRAQGVPMIVLFRRAGRALPDIPWL
jgi:hypothetical protein